MEQEKSMQGPWGRSTGGLDQGSVCWVCAGWRRRLWGLTTGRLVFPTCGRRSGKGREKKRNIELPINQLPAAVLSAVFMNVNWVYLYLNCAFEERKKYFATDCVYTAYLVPSMMYYLRPSHVDLGKHAADCCGALSLTWGLFLVLDKSQGRMGNGFVPEHRLWVQHIAAAKIFPLPRCCLWAKVLDSWTLKPILVSPPSLFYCISSSGQLCMHV